MRTYKLFSATCLSAFIANVLDLISLHMKSCWMCPMSAANLKLTLSSVRVINTSSRLRCCGYVFFIYLFIFFYVCQLTTSVVNMPFQLTSCSASRCFSPSWVKVLFCPAAAVPSRSPPPVHCRHLRSAGAGMSVCAASTQRQINTGTWGLRPSQ